MLKRVRTGVYMLAFSAAGAALLSSALAPPSLAASYGGGNVGSYSAPKDFDYGTVVKLVGHDSNKVEAASKDNLQDMFGVTVDPHQLPMTITHEEVKHEVFVATSGTYNVLVSTQNGEIESGDYLTLSSVDGVLMRADTKQKTVFGRANSSFSDSSVSVGNMTLQDTANNRPKKIRLGLVPVTIKIEHNPNEESTKVDVPKFLEDIGQQIAKKEVSPIRIYISLAITAVSLVTAIVVLYSGVRNSIISIGRNPMSKKSIFRALLEIILTSIAVLMVGLFAVYLLLRL